MKKSIFLFIFFCFIIIYVLYLSYTMTNNTITFKNDYNKILKDANSNTIDPSLWAAVDGLGRTVPLGHANQASNNKYVGIFYHNWHNSIGQNAGNNKPYNLSEIYAANPDAKNDYNHSIWSKYKATNYWWNEPIYGYYRDDDAFVLRKQVELLADAGVDFVILDCSNGNLVFDNETLKLFEIWSKAKNDGINVPKITFLLGFTDNSDMSYKINHLYKDFYTSADFKNKYSDLWFRLEGDSKPFLLGYPSSAINENPNIKNFFTFREPIPGYFHTGSQANGKWGWLSTYPQAYYMNANNSGVEMTTVGVAQNANAFTNSLTAMNGEYVMGRSHAANLYSYSYKYRNSQVTVDGNNTVGTLYGRNFQQQWDYAISLNPQYIFVTGWNEWTVGREKSWPAVNGVLNAFPDQFNDEYSRDIEPSKGVLKDNYYYQLVSNIRKYKGLNKPKSQLLAKTINIKSSVDQWNDNGIISYNHYTNTVGNIRNSSAWGLSPNITYTNNTLRNDIKVSKVSYDSSYIYFYVETVSPITSYTGKKWMRLLIDTIDSENNNSTKNWEEFEYILNRTSASTNTMVLEKSKGGWNWEKIGDIEYTINKNVLQLAIPRYFLGLTSDNISFNFKWADNNITNDNGSMADIMSVYTDGDTAPGGRFSFHFDANYHYSAKTNNEYVVSFDTNGGNIIQSQIILNGMVSTKPDNPTREGYTFVNWYTSNSFKEVFNFNTTISKNITLYAKWKCTTNNNGDVNNDGKADLKDAKEITKFIIDKSSHIENKSLFKGDINGDGLLKMNDVMSLVASFK